MARTVNPTKEDKFATAILNRKEDPHRLLVHDSNNDDNSVVTLSQQKMDELQLFRDDTVLFKACSDAKYDRRIKVLPIDDAVEGMTRNLFKVYLKSYFLKAYRLVREGDTFITRAGIRAVEFKVIETDPIKCEEEKTSLNDIDYDNIGGLENVKCELQELIHYPIKYPEKFLKFGTTPSRDVLLYGPSDFKSPELLTMSFSESEINVRDVFEKARQIAPCVLFFDDLDSITRDVDMNSLSKRTQGFSSVDLIEICQRIAESSYEIHNQNIFA
ncbi:unnamed protein product [Adineta steineri]|uniref:ATPase AAA-type core domain-containing protein n=1 Tax=Adineta steineri TaxID=433720 RepID=A0A819MQ14_9BILA|nr:unnamed protein product [Adineta steineri]CAF3984916.1 unnamed protein product [Adineta steineri]